MSSMITTSAWVPRGFAAPFPAKYNFDESEFERIAALAKLQLDDANEDLQEAQEEENSTNDTNGASGEKPAGGSDNKTAAQGGEAEE